ncbi:tyrosine-type recombinase/integrase [Sabulicella glaciei]|uniref:Integrase arm-type DNA-binding domain-containing protein n=1 Tax=Sabulicella glaciei TaxID=2984948 RepID=A0ABT3NRE2_9PROT|nr:integrase arm-type DNA-binding domain-containing protein [Roseococcus sp. MDT2-1-1]MCW8084732.1 integrase arm-type DNA-binding domain-containing protein [Roseococcus sp. MDT2-1-1]
MARTVRSALNAVRVAALVKRGVPGRHADGGGLYLHVTGKDAAKWSMRFMVAGRAREMGLGRYAADPGQGVTLQEARTRARAARTKLDVGVDPLAEREAAEAARQAEEEARRKAEAIVSPDRTFKAAFEAWLEAHGPAMRTERQRRLARGLMNNHVFPRIGGLPVAAVGTADMKGVLEPIWRSLPETSLRVRIRCEAVFAWAKAAGWREAPNPAIWKDNLAPLLGRQGEAARVTHHKALPWQDVPSFMNRLEGEASMSALALRLIILTAARTGEAIGATGAEIRRDAPDGPVWVVPASRMKMGVEHRVPLSPAALAVLEEAAAQCGGAPRPTDFVFPGAAGSRGGLVAGGRTGAGKGGLSQMALLALLRRLKVADRATVHGFRSSFRDWVAECTATPEAVAEAALAHAVGSDVMRAYQRSDLLEKRRMLMNQWAAFCTAPAASVADLASARAQRAGA